MFFSLNSVKSVLHIDTEGATYSDLIVMHHCIITSVIHSVLLQQLCCCHCWVGGGGVAAAYPQRLSVVKHTSSRVVVREIVFFGIQFIPSDRLSSSSLPLFFQEFKFINLVFRRVCLNLSLFLLLFQSKPWSNF